MIEGVSLVSQASEKKQRNHGCIVLAMGLWAFILAGLFTPSFRPYHPSIEVLLGTALAIVLAAATVVGGVLVLVSRGRGALYSIPGILCAGIGLYIWISGYFWVNQRGLSPGTHCMSNVKQLTLAQLMYAQEGEGRFPPADSWPEAISQYVREEETFFCPRDSRPKAQRQGSGKRKSSYTMSRHLGGQRSQSEDAAEVSLLFDGEMLFGGHEAAAFRHSTSLRLNVGYADGHASSLTREEFGELRLK